MFDVIGPWLLVLRAAFPAPPDAHNTWDMQEVTDRTFLWLEECHQAGYKWVHDVAKRGEALMADAICKGEAADSVVWTDLQRLKPGDEVRLSVAYWCKECNDWTVRVTLLSRWRDVAPTD